MAKKKRFEVIHDFTDLQDAGKVYRKGDRYPKPANKKVKDERIEELQGNNNKLGKPVIKEVE